MIEKPTVLVVEDDPSLLRMLSEVLTLEGYPLEEAVNGKVATDILDNLPGKMRIMLLGMNMPVMDGWAVLRWFAMRPGIRARTYVVAMSAKEKLDTIPDEQVEAKLAKPFSVDGLLATLARLS